MFLRTSFSRWTRQHRLLPIKLVSNPSSVSVDGTLTRDEQPEVVDAQERITKAQRQHSNLIWCQTRGIPWHRRDRADAAVEGGDGCEGFLDRGERDDVLDGLYLGDLHPPGAAAPHLRFTSSVIHDVHPSAQTTWAGCCDGGVRWTLLLGGRFLLSHGTN